MESPVRARARVSGLGLGVPARVSALALPIRVLYLAYTCGPKDLPTS